VAPAGRYELRRELGGGGMALVFEVYDPVSERSVALKRLRPMRDEAHARRAAELLAREYHTLAQLAHPGIVSVFDYGVDALGPYYTMELLDGGDLDALAPCDPLRACAIAREVCSALAFLHARRLLHRDVSAANIRCTADGVAKLIDFGTVTHMGPSKLLIGTPVYCPPEALFMQPLDARADLFALGASLYFVLTGQHAYPAWDFPSLPGAWQRRPARPAQLVPNVPPLLDELVYELIQPERELRPRSAAVVMERLGAIEGHGASAPERSEVVQAYLTLPPFIGRELELARVKRQSARAGNGRGGALLVRGPAGVGMSRFLDASILAAKLSGFLVLRADASDAAVGDCGSVGRLLQQLTRLMPELLDGLSAAERGVLDALLPVAPAAAVELAQRLILQAPQQNALLIAIDELDTADAASLSLLVTLAQAATSARLLVIASAAHDAMSRAPLPFGMFARCASELQLVGFSHHETEQLLASVFGVQGPVNLTLLAERLYRLTAGNPRDLMLLAQYMADAGLARYHMGAWALPADAAHAELPAGVSQLLASRLATLHASARTLACGLALSPELSFSFEECRVLSGHAGGAEVLSDLDALVRADVVRGEEGLYTLADRAFVSVLIGGLDDAQQALLYRRLAEVFAQRPNASFRRGRALWRAGERAEALQVFIASTRAVSPELDDPDAFRSVVRSLPADWSAVCEDAVAACRALGCTRHEELTLRLGWALLVSIAGSGSVADPQLGVLVSMAVEASPLPEYAQLSAALPAQERLSQALAAAEERYAATPEPQRLMGPVEAISLLKDCVRYALGAAAPAYDVATVRALPSFEPFYVIAPALGLIDELRLGVHARLTGRWDEAREIYRELLGRLQDDKPGGMDEAAVEYTRLFVLSALITFEALLGVRCSEEQLAQLERHPIFHINASMLRGLSQLWMGDVAEAEQTIQAAELQRLRSGSQQVFERVSLIWQLQAYVALEDVARTRQTLSELEPLARSCPGWTPFVVYGQAELLRLQGTPQVALDKLNEVLARVEAGDHHAWMLLVAARIRALDALGRSEEAASQGIWQLSAAEVLGPSACQPILLALCVAAAHARDARAVELAERTLTHVDQLNATGLQRALAHEARATVALLTGDRARYEDQIKRVQAALNTQPGSAFGAKLQRLLQLGAS
jgi:tetratricopeptide (TPR) repeat protein